VTTCKFDAVLLDYEMPDMNGCDLAFKIERVRSELVMILLSGSEVRVYALALVDAFCTQEASQPLLSIIGTLCSRTRDPQRQPEGS
jgi:CheY-like chemotaxis protein